MFRKLLLAALALTAAAAGALAGDARYRVEHRRPQAEAWSTTQEFDSLADAQAKAAEMQKNGYKVRILDFGEPAPEPVPVVPAQRPAKPAKPAPAPADDGPTVEGLKVSKLEVVEVDGEKLLEVTVEARVVGAKGRLLSASVGFTDAAGKLITGPDGESVLAVGLFKPTTDEYKATVTMRFTADQLAAIRAGQPDGLKVVGLVIDPTAKKTIGKPVVTDLNKEDGPPARKPARKPAAPRPDPTDLPDPK